MTRIVSVALLLVALVSESVLAQATDPAISGPPVPAPPAVIARDASGLATLRTMRVPSPPIFDGRLDETFYRDVPSFGDFIQQDPFEGQPETEKTEVWVFFDDTNIYVSARLWEQDKSRRVANEMRRDSSTSITTTISRCCSTPSTTTGTATPSTPIPSAGWRTRSW